MNRRHFFRNSSLALAGTGLIGPQPLFAASAQKAKNIIFLVSDGMSTGTLHMANLYCERTLGRSSHWIQLYKDRKASRGLMDTQSANSIVTDSAAGSSAFGGGFKVNNGSLNIHPDGRENMPIWQKFKKAGKKAGIVTSVTATHATPAGFCVTSKSRNAEPEIAEKYLELGIDVVMGGGDEHFNAEHRKDKKDLYAAYAAKGYEVAKSRDELQKISAKKPLLAIFSSGAIPYAIDRENDPELKKLRPL